MRRDAGIASLERHLTREAGRVRRNVLLETGGQTGTPQANVREEAS